MSDSDLGGSDNADRRRKDAHSGASGKFTIAHEQTEEILQVLKKAANYDELKLKSKNKPSSGQGEVLAQLLQQKDEYSIEDETAEKIDKQDEIRIARLEASRPRWLTLFLNLSFHLLVFVNFFMSWYDSARLLLEDAKLNLWLIDDEFNCLEIVENVDYVSHIINIMHALLSCTVLYVHNRKNASLCLAWICSQGVHMTFTIVQYFYNFKFEPQATPLEILLDMKGVFGDVLFTMVGSLILLHKYYDLTDLFKSRLRYFGTTDTSERCLNGKIIFRNETYFLQRKSLLRQVTSAQTFTILRKLGKHAKLGVRVDQACLEREINAARMALADCVTADNHKLPYMLSKSYAHRMKQLEAQAHAAEEQQQAQLAETAGSVRSHPPIIHSEIY